MSVLKILPLLLFSVILSAAAQDHVCVDLNGNKTHATVKCSKMGMLDAEEGDNKALGAMQCPGLKDAITQLEESVVRQDKLMPTPYSAIKKKALTQQLDAKRQRYQRACM